MPELAPSIDDEEASEDLGHNVDLYIVFSRYAGFGFFFEIQRSLGIYPPGNSV